jgi:hypothetical protein
MDETQKKKLADLIVSRLAADGAATATDGYRHYVDLQFLDRTLEGLTRNGFEPIVRHKWRKGMPRRMWEMPKDHGEMIYLKLVMVLSPRYRDNWKQVWVALDKEIALKMLVLGTFHPVPETT